MSARENIAYLKGLIDGQNIADTPEKKKFYAALIDALDSLADAIEEHEKVHQELNDYLEQLDEDVCSIEDDLEAIMEQEGEEDDEYDDFDEEEYDSVTCPNCGKDFYFEPAAYEEDEDLLCPHCGKPFKYPEE